MNYRSRRRRCVQCGVLQLSSRHRRRKWRRGGLDPHSEDTAQENPTDHPDLPLIGGLRRRTWTRNFWGPITGRGGYTSTQGEEREEEEEVTRRDIIWVRSAAGGVRGFGRNNIRRPRKNNMFKRRIGGDSISEFLRMQFWKPHLSRQQRIIMGSKTSYNPPVGEERFPRGWDRRLPHTMLEVGEADTKTTRAATMVGICTAVVVFSVPGGRR